jgi:hypothetical protein
MLRFESRPLHVIVEYHESSLCSTKGMLLQCSLGNEVLQPRALGQDTTTSIEQLSMHKKIVTDRRGAYAYKLPI